MNCPTELEFLESFGVCPIGDDSRDGTWTYEFAGAGGHFMRLSFNTHGASVQTTIFYHGQAVFTVVQEGGESLVIDEDGGIRGEFGVEGQSVSLAIGFEPNVTVSWSSLIR